MKRMRWVGALACAAGALGAWPALAGANVQVGSSGWLWGNPLPQGNTLRALSFAGSTGYAAGDFGTLLRTADGGATWSGLLSGTFAGLTEVQAIDADSLFAGGGCVARRSDDGGATFKRLAFTPVESSCREQLAAGWFTSDQTGYLVLTDGTVLRTDNDGQTFAQRTAVPGTRAASGSAQPLDLQLTSATTGVAATSDGKVYRTTDGANSWTVVSATARSVHGFFFVDASTGFAVGDASLLLATTDGGATWAPRDLGLATPTDLRSINCASATLCVIATERGDQLVRTADGGASSSLVTPSADPVHAAAFASATRIAAVGAIGATAISDDGGATFSPIGGRLTGSYSRVRAGAQPGTAFAPGDNGSLARTVDGGRTWTRGNVSTSEDVLDVSFPTAQAGFALDVAGGLFATADGGATWRALDTGTTARPQAILAPTPATVLVVGPVGVRRSVDAGDSFAAVRGRAVARARLGGVDPAGRAVFAYGAGAIVRSSDRGRTWTTVPRPSRRSLVRALDFVDARHGFLLDSAGVLWRTSDGGRRWGLQLGVATNRATGLSFASRTRGYLVIPTFGDVGRPSGFLLRTTDAGRTWHPQFVVSTPILGTGVAATAGGTDYLLGTPASLLASTTGGDAGQPSTIALSTAHRRYARPTRVTVTVRLSPARGNERVTVSYRPPRSNAWRQQTVSVAANGSVTTSWRLAVGANTFVAQWAGDFRSRGDGSPPLTVRVGR
jgi:photosystem II stability/assembly factor-like uncharacterized protein